jgi:hypothetical protein
VVRGRENRTTRTGRDYEDEHTELVSVGGTRLQTAWSKVLSSLQGATPSLVVIQWSAFPLPGTSAASSLSRALVSIVNPPGATAAPVPIVGASFRSIPPALSSPASPGTRLSLSRAAASGDGLYQ